MVPNMCTYNLLATKRPKCYASLPCCWVCIAAELHMPPDEVKLAFSRLHFWCSARPAHGLGTASPCVAAISASADEHGLLAMESLHPSLPTTASSQFCYMSTSCQVSSTHFRGAAPDTPHALQVRAPCAKLAVGSVPVLLAAGPTCNQSREAAVGPRMCERCWKGLQNRRKSMKQ